MKRAWLWIWVLTACSRATAPAPLASREPAASAAQAPLVESSKPAPAPPETPLETDIPKRLAGFFRQFRDGSDYEFLRAELATSVRRFMELEGASPDRIVAYAKEYSRGKTELSYKPNLAKLIRKERGGETIVHIPVETTWQYPAPDEWSDEFPQPALVNRSVAVEAEFGFDASMRVVSYLETPAHPVRYRVTGEPECPRGGSEQPTFLDAKPEVPLAKGAIVEDLGETFEVSLSAKGPTTARHVRFKRNDIWVIAEMSFAVDNPNGGTSAGGSTCLERLPR